MSSMSLNGAKKPVLRCDSAKRKMNNDRIMERGGVTAVYRESENAISTDSGESSGRNSVCNDSDYQTSVEDPKGNHHYPNVNKHQYSRDEIVDKLSKIKIGYNKNTGTDSGTVDDTMSEDDVQSHSIIAGHSPTDLMHFDSIDSIPDSRFSIILAGRLDIRENLLSHVDEHSLLNNRLNETVETSGGNAELSRYVDSLEVLREEVSSPSINERDSLEKGASYAVNDSGNPERHNIFYENNENLDPNSADLRKQSRPKIISNDTFYPPVQIAQRSGNKTPVIAAREENESSHSLSKNSIHSDSTENRFKSLITESEMQIYAAIKTPNVKALKFVESCQQSSPIIGVHANTFGSDLLTDISRLSSLGVKTLDQDQNAELDRSRDEILSRYSEKFAKEPTKFIDNLLTAVEASILQISRSSNVNPDHSGVSLRNITAEIRKLFAWYIKRTDEIIVDISMPDLMKNVSKASAWEEGNTSLEEAAVSSFQNFSKLGGGRKVYRKTPRRVLMNGSTQCGTPNCTKVLHREKRGNLYSPSTFSVEGDANNTAAFVVLEELLQEASPTKRTSKPISSPAKTPGLSPHVEKKIDQLMALLEKSDDAIDSTTYEAGQKNLTTILEDFQEQSNSTRQKLIENSSSSALVNTGSNQKCNYHEMEQILTAGLVAKRRKCFEEAKKVFENKESVAGTKGGKSLNGGPKVMEKNHPSRECDHEAVLIRTLSAYADYIDHLETAQYHRSSILQCILESSENPESPKENTDNSNSLEYAEAVILPAQNRAEYRIENADRSPKNVKLVAETNLYLPGTLGSSCEKSLSKSPKARSHLSPVHSHLSPARSRSPRRRSSSVLSKKIRSPVSPAKRKAVRAVKPASHARTPRTPSTTPEIRVSKNKQISLSGKSGMKSTPRLQSNSKLKPVVNSPGLMDVTNTKKRCEIPKVTLTNASPSYNSPKKTARLRIADENGDMECQRNLFPSETDTPEYKETKYFFTPGNTPTYGKVRQKKKYFETPKEVQLQGKLTPHHSPGSYRINYNTVQSPVAMYIRGTNPNLITNVRGKTNERMLTPRSKTPNSKSKVPSPILARSPCMSPKSTESAGLKFQLTPARRQQSDILNIALCESDPSSMIGSESSSHSPFPKIFYKPAQNVKMVGDQQAQRRYPRVLVKGTEEKIIYRHEGRVNSAKKSNVTNYQTDGSSKDSTSCDSGDISLLHQRPAVKSNYLFKK